MQEFKIGKYSILKGTKSAEPKYRIELSSKMVEAFGRGPFDQATITKILFFSRDYYIAEFEKILSHENSYIFYKKIMWFHEQATALRVDDEFNNLPEGITKGYIGEYRRILKLILEHGCLVELFSGEIKDRAFVNRFNPCLNDLLFLGHMIYRQSESIAEQSMIEDAHDVVFDGNGLYIFRRRHHYEIVFKHISEEINKHKQQYLIDPSGSEDFKIALTKCLQIDSDNLQFVIHEIMYHFQLESGDVISVSSDNFIKDIASRMKVAEHVVNKYFAALTLDANNKLSISDLVKKPHSLNRYLYRPFLKWKINGEYFYVFGNYSMFEAENTLILNTIPWGKMPSEWQDNACFADYVNRKKDKHDKWLDDEVEKIIISTGSPYQRSVKKIVTPAKTYSLLVKNLGEIDFLIVCPAIKKILIAECKHLTGRYDMVNWKNDYAHFTLGEEKAYNVRLGNKVRWFTENRRALLEHFDLLFRGSDLSLAAFAIEGVFFINSPTFYMYNSEFRIYTYDQIEMVITGKHEDPTFTLHVEAEESSITYFVKYPYFQKPRLIRYDIEDDDYEVDKYGYPIRE
jgi:hypothetical protein